MKIPDSPAHPQLDDHASTPTGPQDLEIVALRKHARDRDEDEGNDSDSERAAENLEPGTP